MQVNTIAINAAEMAEARQRVPGNNLQIQAGGNSMFGPECRITISQEGRKLSNAHTTQAVHTEENTTNVQSTASESNPSRSQVKPQEDNDLRQNTPSSSFVRKVIQEDNDWKRKYIQESMDGYLKIGFTGDEAFKRVYSEYQSIWKRQQEWASKDNFMYHVDLLNGVLPKVNTPSGEILNLKDKILELYDIKVDASKAQPLVLTKHVYTPMPDADTGSDIDQLI